jgi:hypothetical protein
MLVAHTCNPSYSGGRDQSVGSQLEVSPGQIFHETLSPKYPSQKRAGGVAQGVGPEFKPPLPTKKKQNSFLGRCFNLFWIPTLLGRFTSSAS